MNILNISFSLFKEAAQYYQVYFYKKLTLDGYILGAGHSEVVYTTFLTLAPDNLDYFFNNIMPTAIEVHQKDDVIAAPVLNHLKSLQKTFDISDNVIYIGTSKLNTDINDNKWTIQRIILNEEGNPTKINYSKFNANWNNRINEDYY